MRACQRCSFPTLLPPAGAAARACTLCTGHAPGRPRRRARGRPACSSLRWRLLHICVISCCRAGEVRLLGEAKEQLGVMSLDEVSTGTLHVPDSRRASWAARDLLGVRPTHWQAAGVAGAAAAKYAVIQTA